MALWAVTMSVRALVALLKMPSREQLSEFGVPLRLPATVGPQPDSAGPHPSQPVFIAKAFAEGLQPLVWLDAAYPEAYALRVLQALWPRAQLDIRYVLTP